MTHRKMTSKGDKPYKKKPYKKTLRRPYRKKTSQEFILTGRLHHKKTTLQKDRKEALQEDDISLPI